MKKKAASKKPPTSIKSAPQKGFTLIDNRVEPIMYVTMHYPATPDNIYFFLVEKKGGLRQIVSPIFDSAKACLGNEVRRLNAIIKEEQDNIRLTINHRDKLIENFKSPVPKLNGRKTIARNTRNKRQVSRNKR